MARRPPRPRRDFEPSDEAVAMLKADYPSSVKVALLLSAKGGRQRTRRCLLCGKRAAHAEVWMPTAALQVVSDPAAVPKRYWLCAVHHGQVPDAEVQARLYPGPRR